MPLNDTAARSLQLAEREWAIGHEREIFQVLSDSSDVENRRIASELLGYAVQSKDRIPALFRAASDPDKEVRNNVTRALGVLARGKPSVAAEIPPDAFIQMLNSGIWTDRNKGAMLAAQLTMGRNPDLLAKIRTEALDSCIEMALWRGFGHAGFARTVLGRVADIPEDSLNQLACKGPAAAIVEAARRQ